MIELRNVEIWKRAVDAISAFITEGNFRFSEQGIKFKATDPSQIVLVDFELDKKVFDKYDIEPTYVGLDVSELGKIMSRAQASDKLYMDLTDSELIIKLEGELMRTFNLPLIDVPDVEINPPKQNFDAKVEIAAKILRECLKDASLFDSSVILKVKNTQFLIEAKSNHGTLSELAKKTRNVEIKASSEAVAKYSLSFFQNIVKEAHPDDKISLELKSDSPMKVSYKIGTSTIQFYLAPMTF